MNGIRRSGTYRGKYYSKASLNRYGDLMIKCKVRSNFGESIEHGKATGLNVRTGLKFLMSKALTQVKFGHINRMTGDWKMYYSASDTLLSDDNISIMIIDSKYAYDTFKGQYKFKTFNVKGKKYTQSFVKSGGKYKFAERTRTQYTKKSMIKQINEDLKP